MHEENGIVYSTMEHSEGFTQILSAHVIPSNRCWLHVLNLYITDYVSFIFATLIYEHIIVEMLEEDDFEYWQNIEVPKLTTKKFELMIHVEW